MSIARSLFICVASLSSTVALAQDAAPDYIPEAVDAVDEDARTGWTPFLVAGGNVSYASSKNVVGVPDGNTFTGGLIFDGGVDFLDSTKRHEWTTRLGWALQYTNSPAVPIFVKSTDALSLQSTWLYHLPKADWFGPFADLRLTSSVFPGYYVGGADATLQRLNVDGTAGATQDVAGLDQFLITESFSPTTIRESVGVFAQPLTKEAIAIETRAGVGAWESFVRDGYYVADDDTTDTIEIQQMQDSVQVGAEVNVAANGALSETLSYTASAAVMQPFIYNVDTDLKGMELLNQEYAAGLSVKLTKWAALQYEFNAVRTPLVIDLWQVRNGLLLSFSANVVGGDDAG